MVMEYILIQKGLHMKGNGNLINKMAKVLKSGVTDQSTKDYTRMVAKAVMENSITLKHKQDIKENGLRMLYPAMELIFGKMERFIQVSLPKTSEKGLEDLFGQMKEFTRVSL